MAVWYIGYPCLGHVSSDWDAWDRSTKQDRNKHRVSLLLATQDLGHSRQTDSYDQ